MDCAIKSPDPSEYPERFGDEAAAVQLKVAPATDEEKRISVVCPEQMLGVVDEMIKSGSG